MLNFGACSAGTLERGAPMENGFGARSANVEIVWSGLNCGILSERGALFYSEMGSERGAAIKKKAGARSAGNPRRGPNFKLIL